MEVLQFNLNNITNNSIKNNNNRGIIFLTGNGKNIKSNDIVNNRIGIVFNGTDSYITNTNITYNRIYNNESIFIVANENIANNSGELN
ncbi:hypothetical protein ALNOE001_08780 [Candidatus Methanobinarius endosymbioticus]|uniref:Uncharacterized protein n=1 Tax=Candidatus Methanobinarius endosymbioticus TaxID=2006182 RepID=A0A366MCG9_9EURY|nr:hypothetical protein ALNOE001_08780 [Candidatus Methanobinarius endosymbioticus]